MKSQVLNFDDSSDEELVVSEVDKYSLQQRWEEFCKDSACLENNYDKKLPFFAHAFGIGLLYSKEVGNVYYGDGTDDGLKAKYLSSILTPEILMVLIDKALLQTLKMFYDDIDEAKFQEVKKALNIDDVLKAIIENVSEEYRVYIDNNLLKIVDGDGDEFFNLAAEIIDNAIDAVMKPEDLKGEPDSYFASFYNRGLRESIPYLERAGIIVDNETVSSRRDNPHFIGKKANDFSAADKAKPDFPEETCQKIKTLLIDGNKKKGSKFEGSLADGEEEIAQAFFQDCITNPDIFRSQIRQNLCETFLMEVRKDLPDTFLTEAIDSAPTLLANLRLSNRSATRKMRRLNLTSQITADAFEEFFDIKTPSSDSRIWNMKGVPVRESQLVDDSHSRVDMVFESDAAQGGKYPALCKKLNQICKDKKINEAVFAKLIKFNLGVDDYKDDESLKELLKDKSLKQFVAKLSYLLFGCEVARNPASLIMHQMMLDLVECGKKDWEDFFGVSEKKAGEKKAKVSKQLMPMAPEGAVGKARHMHSVFSEYMPRPYRYEGSEDNSADLEKAEKDLCEEWLKYKDIDPQFTKEALLVECKKWYGIDLDPVLYGNDEDQTKIFLKKLLVKDSKDIRLGEYALLNNLLKNYYIDFDDELLEQIKAKNDIVLCAILLTNAEKENGEGYEIEQFYDGEYDYSFDDLRELVSQFLINKIDAGTESNLEMSAIDLLDVCDVNYIDNEDTSLLLWSAVRGYKILFNQIVEHCDVAELMGYFGNGNNDTPIMYTMLNGWIEETEELVNSVKKDTIDERYSAKDDEDDDKTILYFAIDALERFTGDDEYNRWVQVIITILEKGADPNLTYEDSEGIEYNCLTYAISKLWQEVSIKDLPEPDRNLCECLYKYALRLTNGKDETGIEDNDFYKGDNQADFDEWEQEIKKEFEPKKVPQPKSGKQVKETKKTKGG